MGEGLVLYPHFQPHLVPGWLDKALRHRHRASARLDNVVLLPHIASGTVETRHAMADLTFDNLQAFFSEGRVRASAL